MTSGQPIAWVLVVWVTLNLVLFTALFFYSLRLRRTSKSTSIESIASAFVLVSATLIIAAVQRLGIHAARVGLIASDWEDFFLLEYQLPLAIAGTATAVYAVTRLRVAMKRMEHGERMVNVLTESARFDREIHEWGLTKREMQVLDTIVSGRTSDDQIAEALFISSATAATHVRNILKKAGMSRRLDLMLVGSRGEDSAATNPTKSIEGGLPEPR